MSEVNQETALTPLKNPELEIPESVRTMYQSDPAGEHQRHLMEVKEWSQYFKNEDQLEFFLLLPLNSEQRYKFIENLNKK